MNSVNNKQDLGGNKGDLKEANQEIFNKAIRKYDIY